MGRGDNCSYALALITSDPANAAFTALAILVSHRPSLPHPPGPSILHTSIVPASLSIDTRPQPSCLAILGIGSCHLELERGVVAGSPLLPCIRGPLPPFSCPPCRPLLPILFPSRLCISASLPLPTLVVCVPSASSL